MALKIWNSPPRKTCLSPSVAILGQQVKTLFYFRLLQLSPSFQRLSVVFMFLILALDVLMSSFVEFNGF